MLGSPVEARLLGPAIVREIYFRVLTGEQGGAIRAALTHQSQFGKIAKALRRIHAAYDGDLDVGLLAQEAGMSVPAFHVHFKSVTQTSPIQYVKATRLHKARLLMIQDGASAAHACGSRRLRERVAVQPRVQALLRPHTAGGSGFHEERPGHDHCR